MKKLIQRRIAGGQQRPERGTSAPAFLLIFVVVMLVLELVVMVGRVTGAQGAVANAARAAARQGTLVQSKVQVGGVARSVAEKNLQDSDQACGSVDVDPHVDDFDAGGWVEVTVTCKVSLSDISNFGLPLGDITITATHKEIVEKYRSVEPLS